MNYAGPYMLNITIFVILFACMPDILLNEEVILIKLCGNIFRSIFLFNDKFV